MGLDFKVLSVSVNLVRSLNTERDREALASCVSFLFFVVDDRVSVFFEVLVPVNPVFCVHLMPFHTPAINSQQ